MGGWDETALGRFAKELHEKMNVSGLELAIGKEEGRALASPARLIVSTPDHEDLEPPAQQGGAGKHVCEDRLIQANFTVWGASPSDAESVYLRLVQSLRELGLSRRARGYGRVQWLPGAGRAGSAGVKVVVPLSIRLPVVDVDLKRALILGASAEVETSAPDGSKTEGF